ncbi:MAG: DUF971 domain-containing protein [Gammaproteobacteria bacterium]|nr:DUF971 domain-containing protein [Pseudomonadales bacterium]
MSNDSVPSDIRLHRKSGLLELVYPDGNRYELCAEYLRVYSPSAEVRGHGPGQEVLQTGKKQVRITGLIPTGNYALRLVFDDRHDSGIYSWDYLRELAEQQQRYWSEYLDRLRAAGASREPLPPGTQAVRLEPLKPEDPPTGQS